MVLSGRSGQYVLLLGVLALKIGISRRSRQLIRIEAANNRRARQCAMWRDMVVPVTRFGSVLASRRYPSQWPEEANILEAFIGDQVNRLSGARRSAALNLVDLAPIFELQSHGLESDIISLFHDRLASFDMPISASHGDFFDGNAVYRQGRLALIDWDSFREESSFLFDAIHYYINQSQHALDGKSWTVMIFEDFPDYPEINRICEKFGVASREGIFSYALDRLSREITQERGVANLAPHKIEKYLKMCRKLITLR